MSVQYLWVHFSGYRDGPYKRLNGDFAERTRALILSNESARVSLSLSLILSWIRYSFYHYANSIIVHARDYVIEQCIHENDCIIDIIPFWETWVYQFCVSWENGWILISLKGIFREKIRYCKIVDSDGNISFLIKRVRTLTDIEYVRIIIQSLTNDDIIFWYW